MPTFNHISGQEPSTVNFKLATVSQTRNSSVMHQEIMALGDPDTSNAIAAVLNAVPASTAWGLVVRQVGNSSIQGNSTVFQGTSPWVIAGNSTVAPLAGSTWATRPIQSSAADLQMTATQGTSPWVISGNSSVVIQSGNSSVTITAGNSSVIVTSGQITSTVIQGTSPWIIAGNSTVAPLAGSTWATRPIQSSAADLQMTATPAAGSTWRTQPGSTAWASSAGFHFNSSGDLNVAGTFTVGSTVSTGFLSVRISDGSTWVVDYAQASTFTSTAVAGGVNFLRAGASSISSTDTFVMPWGSTFGAQYFIPVTDSGVSVIDSTNRAINVNVVAGAAGGSTIMTVSTVQGAVIVRSSKADALMTVYQSTNTDLLTRAFQGVGNSSGADAWPVLTVDTSNAIVKPGDSANNALRVNVVAGAAGGSTIVTVSAFGAGLISSAVQAGGSSALTVRNVWSSTNTDQPVSAAQAGTWNVGTVTTVSSVAGAVVCRSSKADALVTVYQSSAAELLATVSQGGTWNINSISGLQSSVAPSSGSSGVIVRQVIDAITTVASTNTFTSTSVVVQSSAASIRTYVTALSITTTNAGPTKVGFYDSSGATLLWAVKLAAVSSAVTGVNLAVSAPAYLFRGAVAANMTMQISGSTVAGWVTAVSYFRAP